MINKDKVIGQLRKGYSPIATSPNEALNSIFKKIFKPLVDKKELDFFFELFNTNETLLRAWSFLGIYNILVDITIEDDQKKLRLSEIIIDLLRDEQTIDYFGGSINSQTTLTSLREHHVTRICELDKSLIFEPILEYIKSSERRTDDVIGELLESVLSKGLDSRIEPLILQYAQDVNQQAFSIQFRLINAFENLGQNTPLKEKASINEIFKIYLKYIKEDKSEFKELNERKKFDIINKKTKLKENIFKVAAELELDLEKETFEFLDALKTPYNDLKQIAERYKENKRFKSLILKKLSESDNPILIKDILLCFIILRDYVPNWKELIIENINKFQLKDGDLTTELYKVNFLSEDMLIKFLVEGAKWQLEFIREILINNPEILNEWTKFKTEIVKVLISFKKHDESWEKYPKLKEKKELALKIIIDLENKEMVKYCIDNFINLEDKNLRKIALFAIINFGTEDLWLELKGLMKNNNEATEFFKKFMKLMDKRDWKLYY